MRLKIDIKSILKNAINGASNHKEVDLILDKSHKKEIANESVPLNDSPNLFKPFYDRLEYNLFYLAKDRPLDQILTILEKKEKGKLAQVYIDRAFEQGFIKRVEDVEKLNLLKVDELKNILKSNDLKLAGKKSELVDRISMNINVSLYRSYLPQGNILTRTFSGEAHYHELIKARETEKDIVFADVLKYVLENEYKLACMLLEDSRLFDNKFNLNGFVSYFQPDPMNVRIPYADSYSRLKEKYGNALGSYIITFLIYGVVIDALLIRYLNHNNQENVTANDDLFNAIKSEIEAIKSADFDQKNKHSDHVKDFEVIRDALQEKFIQLKSSSRSLEFLIIDTCHNYIGELNESEKFDKELFNMLFIKKFNEILPALKIKLEIVDDEHCLNYPKVVGVQSSEDKALIMEAVEAVSDYLFFEGEYISKNRNFLHS